MHVICNMLVYCMQHATTIDGDHDRARSVDDSFIGRVRWQSLTSLSDDSESGKATFNNSFKLFNVSSFAGNDTITKLFINYSFCYFISLI